MRIAIKNKDLLDDWIKTQIFGGDDVISIKGSPPENATYEDGSAIDRINICWINTSTKEIFNIEYEYV